MITFQYKCDNCDLLFEVRQSMNDDPRRTCPQCNGELRRVISGGSGFLMRSDSPRQPSGYSAVTTRCGKTQTCCGREVPCETPSCEG